MTSSLIRRLFSAALGSAPPSSPDRIEHLIQGKAFKEARTAIRRLPADTPNRGALSAALEGLVLFHEKNDEAAEGRFHASLLLDPGLAEGHLGLSMVLAERQAFQQATQHAQFAVNIKPKNAAMLAQLGYCHLQLGNFLNAMPALQVATQLKPSDAHAWSNLGIAKLCIGQHQGAIACFEAALHASPGHASARKHLDELTQEISVADIDQGAIEWTPSVALDTIPQGQAIVDLVNNGQMSSAINIAESYLVEQADNAKLPLLLLELYERFGDRQSGMDLLAAWLVTHPNHKEVETALGKAHLRADNPKAAEKLLAKHHGEASIDFEALLYLAQAFIKQKMLEQGLAACDQALVLEPDNISCQATRATTLSNLCRYDEALTICEMLQAQGITIDTHGIALAFLGRFTEAMPLLNKSLEVQPNDANLQFHRACIKLLNLDFETGWNDYHARWLASSKDFRILPFPIWKGEPLAGMRVVVLAEQGLGDQVMFSSCLPDLLKLNPAQVVIEAIDRIAPTIARSFPECTVVASKQGKSFEWIKEWGAFDFVVPLGDLPMHFRRSLASFPQHQGFLKAAPERVTHWRTELDKFGSRPKVGVSWRGGTVNTRAGLRSLNSSTLAALAKNTDIDWVCLQYGDVKAELIEAEQAGMKMTYWPESISDLDEFAALIMSLDLVITVCNTTVHYAGALGKPVWIMAPKIPEWRYGLHNDVLPWYPSSRVIRQTDLHDWVPVIDLVHSELKTWQHALHP